MHADKRYTSYARRKLEHACLGVLSCVQVAQVVNRRVLDGRLLTGSAGPTNSVQRTAFSAHRHLLTGAVEREQAPAAGRALFAFAAQRPDQLHAL